MQPAPFRTARQAQTQPETAVRNPYRIFVTLFLLSLLLPVSTQIGGVVLQPYRLVLLLMFVPMLLQLLSGRAGRLMAVDFLILASTVWSILALLVNHSLSEMFQTSGIFVIEFVGAYLLARVGVQSGEDFRRIAKLMFWILLVLLPFAIMESVTRYNLLLNLLPGSHRVVDGGIRLNLRRAQSVFAHPIHYGVYVSSILGLAWYVVGYKLSTFKKFVAALLVLMATFFSLSTGAIIAFSAQFYTIIYDAMTKNVRRRWRLFAILLISGYVLIDALSNRTPFDVLVDYLSLQQGSAYNRILIWKFGMENVYANPIFGLGYRDWVRPWWMRSGSADNYWLLIAMRHGIPAFVFLALAVIVTIYRVSWANLRSDLDRACRAGFLVTLAGLIVAGGTVHYWNSMFSFVTFMMFNGLWMTQLRQTAAPTQTEPTDAPRKRRVYFEGPPAGVRTRL